MRAPATALPTPIPAAAPGEIEWFFVGFVVPDGVVVELAVPDGVVMESDVPVVVGTGEVIGDESEMGTTPADEVALGELAAFGARLGITEDFFGTVIGRIVVFANVLPVLPAIEVREYRDVPINVAVERTISSKVSAAIL